MSTAGSRHQLLIVLNPHCGGSDRAATWKMVDGALQGCGARFEILETLGDGSDGARIQARIAASQPTTVLAAGGDGTVGLVVEAILSCGAQPQPCMALLPIGTANNVARSLGLRSCRSADVAAVDLAIATASGPTVARIDVGQVSFNGCERYFVGSFAVGMDADILALRNRLSRWSPIRGYPLYLFSCAASVLRGHGAPATLRVDGSVRRLRLYQLLVSNTPLYAGEFRFDADASAADGQLELLPISGALEYLRTYARAWRRHIHLGRGDVVLAATQLSRGHEVAVETSVAVAGQLDGEEIGRADLWKVRVLPGVLTVRVPTTSIDATRSSSDV